MRHGPSRFKVSVLVTAKFANHRRHYTAPQSIQILQLFYGQKYLHKLATRTIAYNKYSNGIAILISPWRFAKQFMH